MVLHGLNNLTLLDYPGHLACTAFTCACNFRCPFCHNAPLVLAADTCPPIGEDEFFAFLKKRRGVLEGVCVTGGEPTLKKDLPDFLAKIKSLGFLVKLDTNGYEPGILSALMADGLVDMVAMDIKNSPDRYADTVGLPPEAFEISRIQASIDLLRSSGIAHEFRTTVVKELHPKECFPKIGEWLKGDSPYFLQQFAAGGHLLNASPDTFHACQTEEMLEFVRLLAPYLPKAALRGGI